MDFEQISATLFNMSDTFIGLYTINNTFNSSTTKAKNGILDDMYLTFNNLMVDWGIYYHILNS